MSSLRDKLSAMNRSPSRAPAAPATSQQCYERITRVPLHQMSGLVRVGLSHLRRIDPNCQMDDFDARKMLFIDTETTGLSGGAGTLAFLLGLGYIEGDQFVVRQIMMLSYAQELYLLSEFAKLLPGFDGFVSYNGKTFDLPLLHSRMTLHRMRNQFVSLPHLDLLHPARRVWKLRLKSCTLGNVEQQVLGMNRQHDLPGSEVPERYFTYLKTGEFTLLEDILEHNLHDIISLGKLLEKLAKAFEEPEQLGFEQDVLSIGRALERQGEYKPARRCYQVASVGETAEMAQALLARSLKREGQYVCARQILENMVKGGQGGMNALVELAKILEHQQKDYQGALAYTVMAIQRAHQDEMDALLHRQARLTHKITRIEQDKDMPAS